jgi:hypothetical protein
MPNIRFALFIGWVITAALISACNKAPDKAQDTNDTKATVAVTEKGLKQAGATDAAVKDGGQSFKGEFTNPDGSKTKIDSGYTAVTEADLGIAFYPGAKLVPDSQSKLTIEKSYTVSADFISKDKPDAIIAFYREKLKAMSAGKSMTETTDKAGAILTVSDTTGKNATVVTIEPNAKGTLISFLTTRPTK